MLARVLTQRRDAELKASAEKLAAEIVAANKTKREEMVKRCEQYEKEYEQMERDLIAKRTIRSLIYKRGYAKLNMQRVPITCNEQIEKVLGKFGIFSVEDLVHEIYTVGPHFKQCNNFLWPFKLNSPDGGFSKKLLHFNEGGDYGNHEVLIGKLVNRMI
ncbi:60S ribosomal protein L7 [Blastocystis sp. ATCC 50177/Nand II]|uniref:60S ribosomal protein L7 n=1 Tax=Blastocystis sp. subtype 1 (strain ATCC 50177 / NandII) TaxID=478820 RepID=A0A196SCH1_BLAHN|nr:60S ribosomal protein L7 [Blastocystis sp. ATCC 50177/Nand II]